MATGAPNVVELSPRKGALESGETNAIREGAVLGGTCQGVPKVMLALRFEPQMLVDV